MIVKKSRLPKGAVESLKKRSGAHTLKKGKRAYDRKKLKKETKKELR